jgi:hypothetical protein
MVEFFLAAGLVQCLLLQATDTQIRRRHSSCPGVDLALHKTTSGSGQRQGGSLALALASRITN